VAGLAAGTVIATPAPASAHERWFVPGEYPTDWGFATSPLVITLLTTMVIVAVAWRLAAALLPTPELPALTPLGRLAPLVPRLLGIHLGIALVALAVRGEFLSPALQVHHLPAGGVFAVAEAAVGVWLVSGVALRWAGATVVAFGPALYAAGGLVTMAENAALVGIAGYLAIVGAGAGRRSAQQLAGGSTGQPSESVLRRTGTALLVLRVGAAVSLIALAFSEKLANPAMARAMLEAEPQLNVVSLAGVSISTDTFIAVAGAVELLFGLLVLSGAAPQVAVLVAAVPFNATLVLFGATEVIGHLPIYGILLALLVYGSNPATATLVRSFEVPRLAVLRARGRAPLPAPR
jgi:hypothetical protein